MAEQKRRRKRLSIDEKLSALYMLANGIKGDDIVSTFGLFPQLVRKLKTEGT